MALSLAFGMLLGAGGPSASAAPPTADWRATAGGEVAEVALSAVGIDLAAARLAATSSDSGSQLTPRSSSTSSNLAAEIVGVPVEVASNTVVAPPGGAETGTLIGLDVLGAVELGALQTRNEARWSGDTACVAGDLLADSRVQTAGVDVGVPIALPQILGTGVATTTGRTELVAGDGALNRSVQATATGAIAAVTVLGEITVTVADTPTLIATSDGSAGGSGATYESGLITVTDGDGDTTTLEAGGEITLDVGLATAIIRAGAATTNVSATGAVTSSVTVLSIEVTAPGVAAEIDLLPLRASAAAPVGGIDCPLPAPEITAPEDGSVIADTTPDITGTGEPGATIDLLIDGVAVEDAATVDEDGNWTYTPSTPLSAGDHEVSATQTLDGSTSPSSAEVTFTIDATAPAAPVVVTPADGSVTTDPTPTVTGTAEPNAEVEVFIDGEPVGTTTADGVGNWTLELDEPLDDGEHTVYAVATDEAGNDSEPSNTNTFTVDATAPAAPVVLTPADGSVTDDTTPTITGTAEYGATVEVFVDGTSIGSALADEAGNWTLDVPTPLSEGPHTVYAVATDEAGNDSEPSNTNTFTIDTHRTRGPGRHHPG